MKVIDGKWQGKIYLPEKKNRVSSSKQSLEDLIRKGI